MTLIALIGFIWGAAAAPRPYPLFETMLEERAYVVDVRADVATPSVADYARARKDWPPSAGLSHRIALGMQRLFTAHLLHVGHFYAEELPHLPRVLVRIELALDEVEDSRPARDRRSYGRLLNARLRVVRLPDGAEVRDIPLQFRLIRATYEEFDRYRALQFLSLDGRPIARGPIAGQWDTVRHVNEGILLDALWNRRATCRDDFL